MSPPVIRTYQMVQEPACLQSVRHARYVALWQARDAETLARCRAAVWAHGKAVGAIVRANERRSAPQSTIDQGHQVKWPIDGQVIRETRSLADFEQVTPRERATGTILSADQHAARWPGHPLLRTRRDDKSAHARKLRAERARRTTLKRQTTIPAVSYQLKTYRGEQAWRTRMAPGLLELVVLVERDQLAGSDLLSSYRDALVNGRDVPRDRITSTRTVLVPARTRKTEEHRHGARTEERAARRDVAPVMAGLSLRAAAAAAWAVRDQVGAIVRLRTGGHLVITAPSEAIPCFSGQPWPNGAFVMTSETSARGALTRAHKAWQAERAAAQVDVGEHDAPVEHLSMATTDVG